MFRFSISVLLLLTALAATVTSLWIFRLHAAVVQRQQDRKAYEQYERVPILGPVALALLDPPSDDEILRAAERAKRIRGGLPVLHETERNNVRIVKEKIADYIDPPRDVPLIGPAQLHHAHYKCTIFYTEVTRVGWPVPHTLTDEDAQEVVYIDHNQFQMVSAEP